MEKKAIIFYHKVDYDGLFSCCAVLKFLKKQPEYTTVNEYGYTYGDQIPEFSEIVKIYDTIFIVDLGFPSDAMIFLKNSGREIIWLDHHETWISTSEKDGFSDLPGKREIGVGACEITWKYLFSKWKTPKFLEYLSAYDVWNKSRFSWESLIYPLQLALKLKIGMNLEKAYKIWPNLKGEYLNNLVMKGRELAKYEKQRNKSYVGCYSFPITVAEKYKGIAMLTPSFTSTIFDSVKDDYQVYCCMNIKHGTLPTLSLYCEEGAVDISLGEYLISKYGERAGGHACSCGTSLSMKEFMDILINKRI